jgi:hypothetical protein
VNAFEKMQVIVAALTRARDHLAHRPSPDTAVIDRIADEINELTARYPDLANRGAAPQVSADDERGLYNTVQALDAAIARHAQATEIAYGAQAIYAMAGVHVQFSIGRDTTMP